MATKMKIMKWLQEVRGLAEISSRRPQNRLPGLVLMQMRSHALPTAASRSKRTLAVEVQEPLDIPYPVKITYLQGNPGPTAAPPNP